MMGGLAFALRVRQAGTIYCDYIQYFFGIKHIDP